MSEHDKINKEWADFEKWFDENYPLAHKFYSRDKDAAWEGWQAAKSHYEETWLIENEKKILALESHINTLRDALEYIRSQSLKYTLSFQTADKALSSTPAESLQAHDDELLEKVISTIESLNVDAMFKPVSFSDMFVAIRALKGK